MLCWRRCSGGSRCCRKGWRSSGAPLPSISPPTSMMKLPHLAPPSSGTKPYLKHQIPLSGIESDFFFFLLFLSCGLFIYSFFFSCVSTEVLSQCFAFSPCLFPQTCLCQYFFIYLLFILACKWGGSDSVCGLGWSFHLQQSKHISKKNQKTIFPACACSLRGKCPTVSALFTFKFRLWLTMNSKYTSVYCWCILLMSGENSDWQF